MFYCGDCQRILNWPEKLAKSKGTCEICDRPNQVCNDTPSKDLTLPTDAQRYELEAFFKSMGEAEDGIKVVAAIESFDRGTGRSRVSQDTLFIAINDADKKLLLDRVMAELEAKHPDVAKDMEFKHVEALCAVMGGTVSRIVVELEAILRRLEIIEGRDADTFNKMAEALLALAKKAEG